MTDWAITDMEIEEAEQALLPNGCHFDDEARAVIRCWRSAEVSACPGSGKTTVLLAKLMLLADRMPFADGGGICVLSHTNVAVDEIGKRLANRTSRLMSHPNYVGTIQSFVDKFLTMPYLRWRYNATVRPVDNETYARRMLEALRTSQRYKTLRNFIKQKLANSGQPSEIDYLKQMRLDDTGALWGPSGKKSICSSSAPSTCLFAQLEQDLIKQDGMIRYQDAYRYARQAVDELPAGYVGLFRKRFRLVLVDEYQDCDPVQRDILQRLFGNEGCNLILIGDPDQAIFTPHSRSLDTWKPSEDALALSHTHRYGQEIANVLAPLREGGGTICSAKGQTGHTPVLIVYDEDSITDVVPTFVSILREHGLTDPDGTYKAIGFVGKESLKGRKIGDYWNGYEHARKARNAYGYWPTIDALCRALNDGQLYRAELILLNLFRSILHYIGTVDTKDNKEYTANTLRERIYETQRGEYSSLLLQLSQLRPMERGSIDGLIRGTIDSILSGLAGEGVMDGLPVHFIEGCAPSSHTQAANNIYVDGDAPHEIRVEFDTVHGVKGETHNATLYLETEQSGSSDLKRILPFLGVGKTGKSNLYERSRRVAYVGMSRPRSLLCVAIQSATYKSSKGAFDEWEVIDIRNS